MSGVNLQLTFPQGALVRLSAAFTNDDGEPVDPDTVTCKTKSPGSSPAVVTYVYGVDVALVKDDVGLYHLDFTADAAGTWYYRFEGTGAGQAAAEATLKVAPSVFA